MNGDARRVRLIFHIGAGKTGTSSIQATLRTNREALLDAGYAYLGLMWEHAPVIVQPWQTFGGHDRFLSLPAESAVPQFREVLQATVDHARTHGLHTLIWSSESFFDRYENVLAPLAEIRAQGVDLEVLAYLRNHGNWSRSAYLQWGIKHKTMAGPVLPFREWAERRRPVFGPTLRRYAEALPGTLRVRNFDAAADVVEDFCHAIGMPLDLLAQRSRENASPDDTELVMRALFNSGVRAPMFPMVFDRQVGQYMVDAPSADAYLARLFPTDRDMEEVVAQTASDREAVSALLTAQGQPALSVPASSCRPPQVDEDALLFALAGLVMSFARRLDALEAAGTAAEAPKARAAAG